MKSQDFFATLDLISSSPEKTRKIGRLIGNLAMPGDVFLLIGKLGSGKTCLTQGIAQGLGINDYAQSPSFVIIRELYGRLHLYHIDLYRLEHVEEIESLGLDDYLYGIGVSVVEWANKSLDLLPEKSLIIEISYVDNSKRNLHCIPGSTRYQELLSELETSIK